MSKCNNCGRCCTACLLMTDQEFETIKTYIKENNITQIINKKKGQIEYLCPFRDGINKKCTIYEVRPEICREFKCWDSQEEMNLKIEKFSNTDIYTRRQGHIDFFNDLTFIDRYMKEQK